MGVVNHPRGRFKTGAVMFNPVHLVNGYNSGWVKTRSLFPFMEYGVLKKGKRESNEAQGMANSAPVIREGDLDSP